MVLVILMVGALFPAVGGSIGKLDLPKGVAELLGGADYGTIAGWMRSEIGAVYGPLVIAAAAIVGAVGSTAGEEESGILALTLAHPIERSKLILAKAAAVRISVSIIALGTLIGLIAGVAVGGGGIALGHLAALALQLAFFGFAIGALALALAAATGRRAVASGGTRGVRGRRLPHQRLRAARRRPALAEVSVAVLLLLGPRSARRRRGRRRSRRTRWRRDRADGLRGVRNRATRPARLAALARNARAAGAGGACARDPRRTAAKRRQPPARLRSRTARGVARLRGRRRRDRPRRAAVAA